MGTLFILSFFILSFFFRTFARDFKRYDKQKEKTETALVRSRWLGAYGNGPQDNGMGGKG